MLRVSLILLVGLLGMRDLARAGGSDWSLDAGVRFFKHSASGIPDEIGPEPVFARWEAINQSKADYTVADYAPLEPLYFNMNFGADLMLRYRQHLMIKVGYDYSNPFGIGGSGHIEYTDHGSGALVREEKQFSYTVHQVNYFIGPSTPVADGGAEIYIGISPMSPTWVRYDEKLSVVEDGRTTEHYDRTWKGFFGSCRAVLGLQVTVGDRLALGSEAELVFLNYMKLVSGELEDHSFQFPDMKWNFTARYAIF